MSERDERDISERLWNATFITNDSEVRAALHAAIAEIARLRAPVDPPKRVSEASALREALEEAEKELRTRLSDERWLRMALTDGAVCSQRTVDAVLGPIHRALEDTKGEG